MASSNISLRGVPAEAAQAFSDAVTAAGGTILSTIPGRPIKFRLTRTCNSWNDGVKALPYEGNARLSEVGPEQTRIDIDLGPAASYFLTVGALGLLFLFITTSFGTLIFPPGLWLVIVTGFVGWKVYQSTSPWANEMMERVLLILSRPPASTTAPPPSIVPPPVMPASPAEPSADVADQLVKLADLHKAEILTDSEYAEKKAELLKRL